MQSYSSQLQSPSDQMYQAPPLVAIVVVSVEANVLEVETP